MKPAIMTFGRLNPFTVGHEHMINTMIKMANEAKATPVIIVTHTRNNKKNPLTVNEKIDILHKVYPSVNIKKLSTSKEHPSIIKVIKNLKNNGYNNFTLMVGENRKNAFGYVPAKIVWLKRPQGAVSATLARTAALKGNVNLFTSFMSRKLSPGTIKNTMNKIRTRMTPSKKRTRSKE